MPKISSAEFLMILLGAVVMSSLLFLQHGLAPKVGPVSFQLQVTLAELVFILAVLLKDGFRGFLTPLRSTQRMLIGMLVLYVIFVSITSDVFESILLAPSWIVHILFFAALVSAFSKLGLDKIRATWLILGVAALLHVGAFLFALVMWPDEVRQMNLPAFSHIRHLGYFAAPAAAVMAAQFVTRLEKPLLSIMCFAAAAFYLFYTGSRGGAAALAAGLAVTGAYLGWRRHPVYVSRAVILLGVTCALILASELLPALPWGPVFTRGADLGLDLVNQPGTVLARRDEVWAGAWMAIEQNWIWGYGPAPIRYVPEYQAMNLAQPHSIFLQLLIHWGALGTAIILATVLSFASNLWAALRSQPGIVVLPLAVLATMCIHALIDGGLFYPFSTVIAIIAFAHLEAIGRRQPRGRQTQLGCALAGQ